MWTYIKMLEYPIKVKSTNAKLATAIISQLGGPDGEKGASTRYLSQRYNMNNGKIIGALTDIGTEELGHEEMVATLVTLLTKNLSIKEIEESGFYQYYVDHTVGIWPQASSGMPFSTATLQSTGDPLADLHEDLAAEQKARLTYDNILRLCKDEPDVYDAIKFLREREIVHYQRFGECLRIMQDELDSKNFYAFNPTFDKKAPCL
ncbi:MAG: manganese catalase family protein [Eubacteriales bacterium]|nr:manganese catalase family protein [Eubacteriales bacterium]